MHGMGKTVTELHAMLKLHEKTLPKKDVAPALYAIRAITDNGHRAAVEAIGSYHLCLPSGLVLVLHSYHYAPSITRGIILVSCLYDDGFINRFENNKILFSRNNVVYFSAIPRNGICEINLSNSYTNDSSMYAVSNKRAKTNLDSTLLWHCRLGHISKKRIEKLQHDGLLNSTDNQSFKKCVSCMSGKMAQKPYTHQVERAKDLLGLIHMMFVDRLEMCQNNELATSSLSLTTLVEVENQLEKTIKSLHSDRRGKYMSQEFLDHLKEHEIISHRTLPYTLKCNGVSARRKRTLLDMVCSMMSQTTLPKSFWYYALESVARILNMVPTKKVEKITYEIWHGQATKLSYLKPNKLDTLVKRDTLTKPDKLEPRSIKCIFIGCPKETMGYCFYYPHANKICFTQNAEFLKNSLMTQEASGSPNDLEIIQEEDMHTSVNTSLHHDEDDQEIDEPQSDVNSIHRSTRTRHAPDCICLYIDLDVMNVEMQSMKDNKVWDLVDLPRDGKTVGSKWLLKKKTDTDGAVHTYKARLVVKGFTQTYGVDYEEAFSFVVNIGAIKILVAIDIKSYHGRCFAMKDLREAAYILGIKIYRDRSMRLFGLCQSAYIEKILKRFYMENSKHESIPIQEKLKLSKSQGASTPAEVKRMQNIPYALAVGSIIAITIANESRITKDVRHYHAKVHYLREVIELGDVKIEKVHTYDNLAGPFTKALHLAKHSEHTQNIGMLPASSLMNYHQLLPIIAEKVHQEKVQQEKLKAVKARLNFEEVSQHSELGTMSRRRDLKKRLGSRQVRSMTGSPEPVAVPSHQGKKIRKEERCSKGWRRVCSTGLDTRGREVKIVQEDTGSQNPSDRSRALRMICPNRGIYAWKYQPQTNQTSSCLHDKIPKSVDEMMRVTTAFLQGEVAASSRVRKKSLPSWKQQEARQKQKFKKGGFQNQQRSEQKQDKFTLLTKTPKEILSLDKGKLKPPSPMTTPIKKEHWQILKAVAFNQITEAKQWERPDKDSKNGETSGKDKPLAILMVRPWQREAKQRITQSFSSESVISFPPLGEEDGTEGPMIIEAEMRGHFVHRMYVDGGSSLKTLYVHCFNRFCPEIRSQMVPTATPLVGFSGEIIWPLGQLSLLVKIGVRRIQAVPSTAHEMLKFPMTVGMITLQSSRIIPLECTMVSGPGAQQPKPADMTGVPRFIAEHRLNIRKGCLSVRQRKGSKHLREIRQSMKK
nr:hypothetical protein [Tanacetum cinerariifolium]